MYRAVRSHAGPADATSPAGTPITALMAPRTGQLSCLTHLLYRGGPGHDHTITLMKALKGQTLAADADSGQAVVNLTATLTSTLSGDLAADDWVALRLSDGTFFRSRVLSVASLAVTLSDPLPVD